MHNVFKEEEAQLNLRVRDDLTEFLCEPHPPLRPGAPFRELRTALVSAAGGNQEQFFSDLASSVAEKGRNVQIADVDARNCSDIRQFYIRVVRALARDDDEDLDTPATRGKRAVASTLAGLASWYEQQPEGTSLVLFVREFESLEPSVFGDFVFAVSECYPNIPLTLALGISTSPDILWRSIHGQAHSRLTKRQFALEHPSVALDALVRRLFLSPRGSLRLAAKPYEMMVEYFLQLDLSLRGVCRLIEYVIMEHYYANALSVLCPAPTIVGSDFAPWAKSASEGLSSAHVAALRRQPSFRSYCESLAQKGDASESALVRRLLTNDDAVRAQVPVLLTDLWCYHLRFSIGLSVLRAVELGVMRRASPERLLYFSGLQQRLVDQPGVRRAVDLLPRMAGNVLLHLADQIFDAVAPLLRGANECTNTADHEAAAVLRDAVTALRAHSEALAAEGGDTENDGDAMADVDSTSVLDLWAQNELASARQTSRSRRGGDVLPRTAGLAHGTRLLTRRPKRISEDVTAFQEAISAVLALCLKHYSEMPLHELWYFSKSVTLRKALHPQPRASIQTALSNPQHYLNYDAVPEDERPAKRKREEGEEEEEESDEEEAEKSDPDTAVLYRLYSESGRLINLYDLFVAFASSVDKRPTKELEESADLRYAHKTLGFYVALTHLQCSFPSRVGRDAPHRVRQADASQGRPRDEVGVEQRGCRLVINMHS